MNQALRRLSGNCNKRMREAMIAAGLPPPRIRQTTFFNISFKRPMFDNRPAAVERKNWTIRSLKGSPKINPSS